MNRFNRSLILIGIALVLAASFAFPSSTSGAETFKVLLGILGFGAAILGIVRD